MMKNTTCVKCGAALKLGGFAHNQDTCFDCFKKEVQIIIERVECDEHKDILNWMSALVAEV